MRRSAFKSNAAWWGVLLLLYALLLWNVALASAIGHPTGILHTFLLAGLLYFVYTGHFLARIALQLWSFFALVFPSAFKIVSKYLISTGSSGQLPGIDNLALNLVMLMIGLTLLIVATIFIEIRSEETDKEA